MAITVKVVGDLRRFTQTDTVELEAGPAGGCSVGSAIDELVRRNPRLSEELFDEQGRLNTHLSSS